MTLTFYIRTYGCQMNERDSEALAFLLQQQGYRPASSEDQADILLFNTCSVRDQAERKVLGKVGLLKRARRARPHLVIGIIGCMAQHRGRGLLDTLPHVDLVVGPDQLHEIPGLLAEVTKGRRGLVKDALTEEVSPLPSGHSPGQHSVFVAVMRGCNQFCTYCIVPYTRGRERSRAAGDIVAEIRELAAQGAREVVLLGQNITAYGVAEARGAGLYSPEQSPFAELLQAVHAVEGIQRIRFLSPHIHFMNDAFIESVCSLPKICKALHIPIQSGSDRILDMMGRRYTADDVRRVVRTLRERVPGIALSTDIIVGFPSESAEDFAATRELMAVMQADMAYIFRYSPRSGTKAAEIHPDDIPDAVKHERNQCLLSDLECSARQRNEALVGTSVEVMLEGPSKRNEARWQGRSDTNKVVIVPTSEKLNAGDLINVKIERATSHSLFGTLL